MGLFDSIGNFIGTVFDDSTTFIGETTHDLISIITPQGHKHTVKKSSIMNLYMKIVTIYHREC